MIGRQADIIVVQAAASRDLVGQGAGGQAVVNADLLMGGAVG